MRKSYEGEEMRAEVRATWAKSRDGAEGTCVFECVLQTLTKLCVLHPGKKKLFGTCHDTCSLDGSYLLYMCAATWAPYNSLTKKSNSKIKRAMSACHVAKELLKYIKI